MPMRGAREKTALKRRYTLETVYRKEEHIRNKYIGSISRYTTHWVCFDKLRMIEFVRKGDAVDFIDRAYRTGMIPYHEPCTMKQSTGANT